MQEIDWKQDRVCDQWEFTVVNVVATQHNNMSNLCRVNINYKLTIVRVIMNRDTEIVEK